MACRKRPAAALSGLPCIDDVRLHVDLVREIMADFPEWGYRRVGARLGELLRVSLEPSDFQAVLRVQKADPMAADARCAVPEREEFHRGMGYVRISNKFAQHFRVKLRPAHLMVVRRIMDGISKGRAVLGAQREPENHESVTLDVRDHSATIQELMMEDPSMDYQAVAHRLEERLQVELSDAQKQGIRGVMGRISIQLVADDMAMPEQSELAVFSGDVREYVREHWDYFLELVESNPELGYKSIGRKLQERLGESLSTAHLQVVRRIMNELGVSRGGG